jgi:hypothetical protein
MWSRNKRPRTSHIRSLIERLEAVEPGHSLVIAEGCSARRRTYGAPNLRYWFSVGFASAWLSGGVSVLAMLIDPADAKPRLTENGLVLLRSGVTFEASRALEARSLWWKLPLSTDRAEPEGAQRY